MADAEAQLASPLAHHRDGRAPSVDGVGGGLRVDASDVAASFPRLEEAHVWVLAPGTTNLSMPQPFSAVPTPFGSRLRRVLVGRGVWKAFGIRPLVEVFTFGPDCNEPMEFRSEGGNLQDPERVVHFAIPARRWWENIVFT